jgi:ADP-ribose pyrophosphatase YjhB (NUDIX family)
VAVFKVVACVVTDGHEICHVRRSQKVAHDRGRWHCVTGYQEIGVSPEDAIVSELAEEIGLTRPDIQSLAKGPILRMQQNGHLWIVHTFVALTRKRRFRLNWENDAYLWREIDSPPNGCVPWLADVMEATRITVPEETPSPDSPSGRDRALEGGLRFRRDRGVRFPPDRRGIDNEERDAREAEEV